MAILNFNAGEVDPSTGFDVLPPGEYTVSIVESEIKETKEGTGKYLELKFQVLEGDFKNRYLWDRLNIQNPNPKTQQIAQANLSAICRAINVMEPKDSSELHSKPLTVKVVIQPADDKYPEKNNIRGYKAVAGTQGASKTEKPNVPWKKG